MQHKMLKKAVSISKSNKASAFCGLTNLTINNGDAWLTVVGKDSLQLSVRLPNPVVADGVPDSGMVFNVEQIAKQLSASSHNDTVGVISTKKLDFSVTTLNFSVGKFRLADSLVPGKGKYVFPETFPVCAESASLNIDPMDLPYLDKAIDEKDPRHYLQGVFIQNGALVATNGKQLHKVATNTGLAPDDEGVIMPAAMLKALMPLSSIKGDDILWSLCKQHGERTWTVVAQCHDWRLSMQVVDGTFPEWSRVMPDSGKVSSALQVDNKGLADEIKNAMVVLDKPTEKRVPVVALQNDRDVLQVHGRNFDATAEYAGGIDATPRDYNDKPTLFVVQPTLILDSLALMPSKVTINFYGDDYPQCTIEAGNRVCVVMPVKDCSYDDLGIEGGPK